MVQRIPTRVRSGGSTTDDAGVNRFELMVAMALIIVLAFVISLTLSRAAGDAVKTACASNVSAVDVAAEYYSSVHGPSQLTVADLTGTSVGALSKWPSGTQYVIAIAGDGNAYGGRVDANGSLIRRNDILVVTSGHVYDATRSFANACTNA